MSVHPWWLASTSCNQKGREFRALAELLAEVKGPLLASNTLHQPKKHPFGIQTNCFAVRKFRYRIRHVRIWKCVLCYCSIFASCCSIIAGAFSLTETKYPSDIFFSIKIHGNSLSNNLEQKLQFFIIIARANYLNSVLRYTVNYSYVSIVDLISF